MILHLVEVVELSYLLVLADFEIVAETIVQYAAADTFVVVIRVVGSEIGAAAVLHYVQNLAVVPSDDFVEVLNFEEKVQKLIKEASNTNIILFIDEIHNFIGTGGGGDGAMNAANLMKPALARGELRVLGATTTPEYRRYIEKDAALERRFQPLEVVEPTISLKSVHIDPVTLPLLLSD